MRANIANIWIVGLVVTFILVFSAYIIITVDYSSTFQMKNDVLTIIEKNKGFTIYSGTNGTSVAKPGTTIKMNVGAFRTINAYLSNSNYRAKGTCDRESGISNQKWIGVKSLKYNVSPSSYSSLIDTDPEDDEPFYYCIARFKTGRVNERYPSAYYVVQMFYKFEIPVLKELIPVRVEGVTDEIYMPADDIFVSKFGNSFPVLYG